MKDSKQLLRYDFILREFVFELGKALESKVKVATASSFYGEFSWVQKGMILEGKDRSMRMNEYSDRVTKPMVSAMMNEMNLWEKELILFRRLSLSSLLNGETIEMGGIFARLAELQVTEETWIDISYVLC